MDGGTVRALRGGDPAAAQRVVFARDLVGAIRERRVVRVERAGDGDGGPRTLRPHVLYDGPSGERYVEGMQTAGPSSGQLPAWRCFRLSEVAELDVLGTTFRPSPVFNPRDDRYRGGAIVMVAPSRAGRDPAGQVPFAAHEGLA